MDFYAFLPSNASPAVYPDNKTSHFKIELSSRMELHGQWQAALIEVHYPNTIAQVTEGENEITLKTDHVVDTAYVMPGCYPTKGDFFVALRDAIAAFGNAIRQDFPFEETSDSRIILYPLDIDEKAKVHFSPRLALQLGLEHPGPYPAHERIYGTKPIDISLGTPPQMYIYMDILSDQIIGHTKAPLLRTIPLNVNSNFGSMSIFYCEHPLYFDLKTKSFDTVEIDIRDHAGRYLPFDHGTLTLLVHFKRLS